MVVASHPMEVAPPSRPLVAVVAMDSTALVNRVVTGEDRKVVMEVDSRVVMISQVVEAAVMEEVAMDEVHYHGLVYKSFIAVAAMNDVDCV